MLEREERRVLDGSHLYIQCTCDVLEPLGKNASAVILPHKQAFTELWNEPRGGVQ